MKFSRISPFVRYARYMTMSRGESYPLMKAYDARLFYVLDGEGGISVAGVNYEMKKGSLLIFAAGTEYMIKSPENHVSYLALNFDYTMAQSDRRLPVPPQNVSDFSSEDILERVDFSDVPELSGTVYLLDMHSLSGKLVSIEREYAMNVIFYETKISAILSEVLCDTVRRLRSETALGGGGKLDAIIWYVHEHYREPLTNESLGEIFGFHKNYISGMIKEYTGMPLHRYLNHVRISRAVEMLGDGELPIAEIARRCGFCDIYYFSRYFKRSVGISPTEYKKSRG